MGKANQIIKAKSPAEMTPQEKDKAIQNLEAKHPYGAGKPHDPKDKT